LYMSLSLTYLFLEFIFFILLLPGIEHVPFDS
jgi:hypothetical protein